MNSLEAQGMDVVKMRKTEAWIGQEKKLIGSREGKTNQREKKRGADRQCTYSHIGYMVSLRPKIRVHTAPLRPRKRAT
jgi:hypothetical protein